MNNVKLWTGGALFFVGVIAFLASAAALIGMLVWYELELITPAKAAMTTGGSGLLMAISGGFIAASAEVEEGD